MTTITASCSERDDPVAAKNSVSILYMEDDAGLARLLQRNLQRLGYVVDVVDNGEKGLAMLEGGGYDLVLLDYHMPVCGGMEVLRAMTARGLPPVIMVTGNGNEKIAVEALKLGANDYVVKDVEMGYLELLPMIIEQVLEKEQLVREREQMLHAVRESEERYRKLVELSPDGIAIHQHGKLVFINPNGLEILGAREEQELLGKDLAGIIQPAFRDRHLPGLGLLVEEQEDFPVIEEKFLRLDQTEVDVEVTTLPFTFNNEPAFQLIFRDISERKQAYDRLQYMANFDPLTSLPNRILFFDRLGQTVSHARRYNQMFALLYVDLDRFKPVNDNLGHDVGDMLLREVAGRMTGCIRDADTVARMGGDEFCIILSKIAGKGDAETVAGKIIAALDVDFCLRGHQCSIGASIGISIFPADSDDPQLLLKMADMAMYNAKENGRNRFCLFADQSLMVDQ